MSESTLLAVPESRILAALSASEMATTQQQLQSWCRSKLVKLRADYLDQRENMRLAKERKWKHSTFESMMRTTKKKIVFYGKMWAAVKAGFVIVPNFDCEIMAVRVTRGTPRHQQSYHPSNLRAVADKSAPVGTGTYVDDTLISRYSGYIDRSDPNKPKRVDRYSSDSFDSEIDFPIAVVKPIVMDATQRAMALRIFDKIGVSGAPRKDPMVLGQILGYNHKVVTFFIAWWLDLESL